MQIDSLLDKKFIGTDELRKKLTKILNELSQKGGELIVTQHGIPKAVLMDIESYIKQQKRINDVKRRTIQTYR
ncbi:hypothetical protein A3B45_02295 [Candidatus Daviesbacteria bacterium RIFCSPLOWO2_01_FULL_39_12]|uniref:Antitoxin n=1 Tax=Candidatus Daviesbacteria bacterium RIFCSPLOWO2_01_FULL_39_12 TaxID=1797785 RepID=A0A1F5KSC1_9BACT|nr:MAG: hypothetical protein A3D79_00705 [Candidatus Daviesbacteria bacterium RIFCSPHIGHO2_02_FULL_39_8]OGE43837.1 MAG: hypothetical protein A3B45_02295 [Candidatus Daviesbacteria bacterium RIFCSPLOWO2_01_FULL_39_12]